jgi:hypothetical protein
MHLYSENGADLENEMNEYSDYFIVLCVLRSRTINQSNQLKLSAEV